jgi:hypothetical protein
MRQGSWVAAKASRVMLRGAANVELAAANAVNAAAKARRVRLGMLSRL